jgi:hypothetical protein
LRTSIAFWERNASRSRRARACCCVALASSRSAADRFAPGHLLGGPRHPSVRNRATPIRSFYKSADKQKRSPSFAPRISLRKFKKYRRIEQIFVPMGRPSPLQPHPCGCFGAAPPLRMSSGSKEISFAWPRLSRLDIFYDQGSGRSHRSRPVAQSEELSMAATLEELKLRLRNLMLLIKKNKMFTSEYSERGDFILKRRWYQIPLMLP